MWLDDFLPCLWAALACAGFCLMFNVRTGILICCSGGALGWLVYLIFQAAGCSNALCCLFAAIAISIFAEIMARLRKYPVTTYLLISSLPLVPGAGIYYTMRSAFEGEMMLFLQQGMETIGTAICLAV